MVIRDRRGRQRYDKRMKESGDQLLFEARTNRIRLSELPDGTRPKTIEDAYSCQGALVQRLLDHYGGEIIGYKIACTNPTAQRQLNVEGPFYGNLLSAFCYEAPARLPADRFLQPVIEPEFAFRMAHDLPATPEPR